MTSISQTSDGLGGVFLSNYEWYHNNFKNNG